MINDIIECNDIMYQDELVCILKPHVKKGIIVWTNYTQPPDMDSLCKLGLKTGKQLNLEGINYGLPVYQIICTYIIYLYTFGIKINSFLFFYIFFTKVFI